MALAERQGRRLVVVGEGSRAHACEEWRGHTTFLGRVSDERLRELYRTAAAFVQLHEEDFGITVVEPACGCPAMVHRTGGHAEIVTDGVGVQVDAENEDAIDAGLVRLLKHPWEAEQAVNRAQEFAPSTFDEGITSALQQLGF